MFSLRVLSDTPRYIARLLTGWESLFLVQIDDNFIALYQASYGVNQETPSSNPQTEPPSNPSASLPTNPSDDHSNSGENVKEVKASTESEGAVPKRRKTDEGVILC